MKVKDSGGTLWARTVWPLLAGGLVAVGLCGAVAIQGVLLTTVTAVLLLGLVTTCVYATFSDDGISPERSLRIGALSSLVFVVLLGLGLLNAPIGWGAAGAAALTSPPVLGLAAARWGAARGSDRPRPVDDAAQLDDAEIARRFETIVAPLERDASTELDD